METSKRGEGFFDSAASQFPSLARRSLFVFSVTKICLSGRTENGRSKKGKRSVDIKQETVFGVHYSDTRCNMLLRLDALTVREGTSQGTQKTGVEDRKNKQLYWTKINN